MSIAHLRFLLIFFRIGLMGENFDFESSPHRPRHVAVDTNGDAPADARSDTLAEAPAEAPADTRADTRTGRHLNQILNRHVPYQ